MISGYLQIITNFYLFIKIKLEKKIYIFLNCNYEIENITLYSLNVQNNAVIRFIRFQINGLQITIKLFLAIIQDQTQSIQESESYNFVWKKYKEMPFLIAHIDNEI